MRVKLSYTVEETDVLKETAKLIGLAMDDIQQIVKLFSEVQEELKGERDVVDAMANSRKGLEMINEFRLALLNVDTRLSEATLIIQGFEIHKINPVAAGATLSEDAPAVETFENSE